MRQRNDLGFYDMVASEWWQETAKIYALHQLNPPRFEYFDRYIPNWQGLKVLDVGCGGGFTCEFLAQRGAIVTGIDQSHNCIAQAQEHAASQGFAIAYHPGCAEALPYEDEVFDVAICVDVLEHVSDLKQTLYEIHRVLKPNGSFCFDTINRTIQSKLIMIWLLEDLLREIPQGIHDWQKFIKPEQLTKLMQLVGFTATEIKGFNIFGTTLSDRIAAYRYYRKTGQFKISINNDTSIIYIGKAKKI